MRLLLHFELCYSFTEAGRRSLESNSNPASFWIFPYSPGALLGFIFFRVSGTSCHILISVIIHLLVSPKSVSPAEISLLSSFLASRCILWQTHTHHNVSRYRVHYHLFSWICSSSCGPSLIAWNHHLFAQTRDLEVTLDSFCFFTLLDLTNQSLLSNPSHKYFSNSFYFLIPTATIFAKAIIWIIPIASQLGSDSLYFCLGHASPLFALTNPYLSFRQFSFRKIGKNPVYEIRYSC